MYSSLDRDQNLLMTSRMTFMNDCDTPDVGNCDLRCKEKLKQVYISASDMYVRDY